MEEGDVRSVLMENQVLLLEDESGSAETLERASTTQLQGASVFQGAVSVMNIVLGIGLLSMPYAMKLAGWAGMASILLCTLLFCWSAKLLAYGLETVPQGVPQSYPQLGYEAFGKFGQHLVTVLAAMELFGGCCLLCIVLWQTLGMFLPARLSDGAVMLFAIMLELPLCAGGSFKSLSVFSVMGCASTVAVMLLVAALPAMDPTQRELPERPHHDWVAPGLAPATGIFALSVAGHSCFPAVRKSMAQPAAFHTSLHVAYTLITAILLALCGIGYWYWGSLAHPLVTEDLALRSPYRHWRLAGTGLGIDKLVQALVLLNVVTTLPLLVLSLQDILSGYLVAETRTGRHKMLGYLEAVMRTAILLLICVIAYTARQLLAVVESMVGALCSIMCSLMLPVVFYVAVHVRRERMTRAKWVAVGGILVFGSFMVVLIVTKDIQELRPHSRALGHAPGDDDALLHLSVMAPFASQTFQSR